jgi:hypothetical protein
MLIPEALYRVYFNYIYKNAIRRGLPYCIANKFAATHDLYRMNLRYGVPSFNERPNTKGVAQWQPRFSTVKISDFKLPFTLKNIDIF